MPAHKTAVRSPTGKKRKEPTFGFWDSPTLEQIMKAQGVKPITDFSKLVCWPEDQLNDGFEVEYRKWRQAELKPAAKRHSR